MLNDNLPLMIGKFAGEWNSGNWAGLPHLIASPRSPLDLFNPSPSLSPIDSARIGLGIAVEIEKMRGKLLANKAAPGQNIDHPDHVQVHEEIEVDDLEDYTFVTCHSPNKSYTKVYCDDSIRGLVGRENHRVAMFYISSPIVEDFTQYPSPDFLNSCDLCKKQLYGKDIYIYRGEQGFCSNECRHGQIVMDQ